MTLDPKRKFYLTLAGSIILPLVIFGAFVLPSFRALKESAGKLLQNREEILLITERQEQLGELEDVYRKNRELIEEVESVLYEREVDDLEFILLIEDIARKTGNTHALSPPVYHEGSKGSPSYFTSSLTLGGSFEELLRFLSLFHTMKFYSDIDALATGKPKGKIAPPGSTPTLGTNLSFKVFTQ